MAKLNNNKIEFFEEEFNRICEIGKWDYEKILSIKNFKSQSVLLINAKKKQEIQAQIEYIKKNFKKNREKSIKNVIKNLRAVDGIGFSTATTILAIANRKQFAILDSRILSFMKKTTFIKYIENSFYVDLNNISSFCRWKSKKRPQKVNSYLAYLDILYEIRKKNKEFTDLREIEFKIFKDSYNY